MRTYSIDVAGIFICAFALTFFVPASSLIDFLSDWSIDLDATSPTRFKIPMWKLYGMAWTIFIVCLGVAFYPAMKYLSRGYIFKLSGEKIYLDGDWVELNQIKAVKRTLRGHRISTLARDYFIHPHMNKSGITALEDFLQQT